MTDIDEKGDRRLAQVEKHQLQGQPDAQAARNAGVSDVKAFHGLNKNAHSGSAGGDQNESIQIVRTNESGKKEVVAERPKEATDKPKAKERTALREQEDTGSLIEKEARRNPVAEPMALTWKWAQGLPPGEQKDSFKKLLKEQAAEISPEIRTRLENSNQARRTVDDSDQENAGSFNIKEMREQATLQGYAQQIDQSRNEWQVFATLPKEQQQQVIHALEQCPELITSDYEKQLEAIAKAVPKGLVNLGQHTIEAVLGVGRAAGAVMEYCERSRLDPVGARERAVKALGEGLEVGLNVCKLSNEYLQGIGVAAVSGDAGKALRDIAWLGQEIDQRWQTRSEAQKVEIATELTAGLVLPGAAAKVARSEKLTTAIAELSRLVGPENRQKLHQGIEKVLGNVLEKVQDKLIPEPTALTPDGQRVLIPRKASDNYFAMSKADDLGGIGKGRAGEPLHERDIVNPIDRSAKQEDKVAQLMALSKQNEPIAEEFLREIDTKFGTKSEISFKEPQDILDKAKRPSIKESKDWFDVEHVRDSFRFKTPVDDLNELPRIVEALKASRFEIVKADLDKLLSPKGRGWRMAAFDLRAPNGQIVEYQIMPKELNEAGKIEHQIYKHWRRKDVSRMSMEEKDLKREADAQAVDLYKAAWVHYLSRTGQTEKTIKEIVDKAKSI